MSERFSSNIMAFDMQVLSDRVILYIERFYHFYNYFNVLNIWIVSYLKNSSRLSRHCHS